MENIEEERPKQADKERQEDLRCRHCGHVHKNKDGSCACRCSVAEV